MASMDLASATTRLPCNRHSGLIPKKRHYATCKAAGGGVDRRDVLIGLGGAAAGLAKHQGALAAPIRAPDLAKCHPPNDVTNAVVDCCPPYDANTGIVDFKLPPRRSPLRVRPAAHLVDDKYVAKYKKAYELMKKLPADDPRSFESQWRVHCAYCDGAYDQVGFPELEVQVHSSWLFFPWHRFYLYFHERILGKLIGDDTFALPFWNWDAPAGMTLPAIYTNNKNSALYNEKRHPAHQPPFLVDHDYNGQDPNLAGQQQIDDNLRIMYRQMISGAKKAQLFMGLPYRAGDEPDPGPGSLENVPHNTIHRWTGDPRQPSGEDMGSFYSAARDPVFFAHHANIDRLWRVWRGLRPGNNDFADADWLDATFLFYDEDARPVRVKVRDCLDTAAMRYTYQDVPLPWLKSKPRKEAGSKAPAQPAASALPATLDKEVRVTVKRPKVSRSRKEKEEEEEMLVVEGIKLANNDDYVKFDVFVQKSDGDGGQDTAARECAGSFVRVPHQHRRMRKGSTATVARFGLSELLEEIGCDGDETIVVTLVPRCAGQKVTVGGISVGFCT